MKICLFGAASAFIDEKYIKPTEELGEYLASQDHELVFGAGGFGLMGAAARGFKKGGARITGIVPQFFKDEPGSIEPLFEECDEMIYTEDMSSRKNLMEDMADAYVCVPGGIGTYEEIFEVMTLKQLGRHNKNIAFFNIDGFYDTMQKMLNDGVSEKFMKEKFTTLYGIFDTKEEINEYLNSELHDVIVKEVK